MSINPSNFAVDRMGFAARAQKGILNLLIVLAIVFALTVNTLEGWSSLSSICAIIFLFFFYVCNRSFYFLKIMTPLVLFSLYSFLSFFWNGSLDYSQLVTTAFLVGMSVLVGLKKKAVSMETITVALMIAGFLNIWFSRDNVALVGDPDDYRVAGLVGNANALAIFLSFTAFVILYVPSRLPKITKLAAVYFIFYSLLFTGSRKGLFLALMTVAYGAGSFFTGLKNSQSMRSLRWVILAVLMGIGGIMYFQFWPGFIDQHRDITVVERTQHFFEGQHNVRSDMIDEGLRLWTGSPWWGWGAGQFAQLTVFRTYSHNNYIEILANYGLLGFILYYGFYLSLIKKAVQKLRSASVGPFEKNTCSIGLYMLVLMLISEWGLVTLGAKAEWIFIMIGAFLIYDEQKILKSAGPL